MKKILSAGIIVFNVLLFTESIFSQGFEDIKKYVENKYLDPLAKDVGGVLGSGLYHSGTNLGFPGFDVGLRFAVKNINKDDEILKASTQTTVVPMAFIQGEVGLPKINLDLIVRALPIGDVSIYGAGIKYTFFKSKYLLNLGISGIVGYTTLKHDYIEANTFSLNACVSISPPVVKPYIGIGYDTTELLPGEKAKKEQPRLEDLKGKADGMRLEAGINISPFPFIYLYGSYSIIYEDTGYTFGLGVKF